MIAKSSILKTSILLLAGSLMALPAAAQTSPSSEAVPAAAPQAPAQPASPAAAEEPAVTRKVELSASFAEKGAPIPSGLKWRVYRLGKSEADAVKMAESDDPSPEFSLAPGRYVVHAAYGLAAATKEIEVDKAPVRQGLVIKAGGLQVEASVLEKPIPAEQLTARVMVIQPTGERRLIAEGVPATSILRLPEGRYFVECTYGESNATVSAEISIGAGKLTQATFHQMAATLTLKLVSQAGGEAIANTAWSVLTPGGDVIRESIGAFPSLILAEGNYTVVARHEGRVYTREFDVKAGHDGDVEVIAR
ncbi:hypothetical protein FZC33_12365 [Labrys sp. KNU-23]|uniref:hypothetical protein n=1 Tax=Labrys sp. KNU-23 TaxID=2789216 RepID=UPI0011F019F8|nr:hypothetical protein [Labrys sp. KNU-23]QEN87074.1 hypothetical protein FZC33_12365 [Labrys sp. KNU-23]